MFGRMVTPKRCIKTACGYHARHTQRQIEDKGVTQYAREHVAILLSLLRTMMLPTHTSTGMRAMVGSCLRSAATLTDDLLGLMI